ncbi:hypothetical protein BHM03_00017538 [Ensete ventricosum]|nr:hypothetical protein BHM03_00017538 [Ensete ventricosum]
MVGNSLGVRWELTEGIGSLPGWRKRVRQKKTETRRKIVGGIGKIARNTLGDRRRKTVRLAAREAGGCRFAGRPKCSSYGERGAVIVVSRGRCSSAALAHRATQESSSSRLVVAAAVLLLLITPPVSSLSDEGSFPPPLPPPCLNPTFHDRDSTIVAWYNPGTRRLGSGERLGDAALTAWRSSEAPERLGEKPN